MLQLSKRVINMPASAIRKLHDYSVAAKKKGIKVYHINIGQPDIKTPPELIRAVKNCSADIIPYTPSQGLASYVTKLSAYYKNHNVDISEDEIIITVGGSEAILFALMAVADPGDDIIIPEPFYTNYNGFAFMAGVNIIPVTTYLNEGFKLPDIKTFEKILTPKTKAVLFSNPCNPTGTVYTKKQIIDLCNFCKKNNLYIISDEAYCEITQHDKIISLLNFKNLELDYDISENIIVVDSISKRFSACGARVGTIVSKHKLIIKEILKFAQARLSASYYGQVMGEAALSLPDSYLIDLAAEYEKRINFCCEELNNNSLIKYHHSEGAFYIIVSLPVEDSDDFAKFLLSDFYSINPATNEKETIMVAPAKGFYKTPGLGYNEIRIACVLESNLMKRASQILKEGLTAYLNIKR
ncbi:pyridoxal phosphate-dependent aminotransferase [Candidatus Dependentiae bacterium]|nr:pyridoxal phosphate-dependent aminotransferase [Candidatus Dependentiae bacterium]